MQILQFPPLSSFGVNSYIVVSETGNGVLIDAPDDAGYILKTLREKNIRLKKLLLTHGHFDHIAAAAEIVRQTGAHVYIHKADAPKLSDSRLNLTDFFHLPDVEPVYGENTVSDGDVITQDELSFQVLHTPGHTSGCVCYIIDDIMFCGDTLFKGSIGRTDTPDGNFEVLDNTLKMLYEFKGRYEDYVLCSGHGPTSKLSTEKKTNPYLIEASGQ
ncbi:MAG: MBL fold metallo-hydrolase [Huintestinicola sp.]